MRVLITIHRVSLGGADRVAMMIASALAAAGVVTGLVILRDGGEGEASLLKLLDERVEVLRAGRPLRSRHLELVRGYRFIQRQVASWRPDLVLASSNNMGLVTGLAVRRLEGEHPRLALKFTNPVIRPRDWGAPRIAYRKRLWGFVLGLYDGVLTLSDAERATLARLYPHLARRFRTVANPYVSDAMLAPGVAELDTRGRKRIVASARLMPQKRIDRLIDAFARANLADTELVILGDGPLRPRIERQVRQLSLADRVSLVGFVEDVVPWLHSADLFALSSDFEGLPAAVLEALACGLPVVTTDCFEAAHELLDGASGCAVVSRTDVSAFARALSAALRIQPDREALKRIALPYRIAAALADHVAAVAGLARVQGLHHRSAA